jgi:hypothetical protein
MKIKLLACAIGLSVIVFQSCEYNELPEPPPVTDDCPVPISFENAVRPIINESCAIPNCHNGDNGADKNWTILSNFQAKKANVKDRINRPPGTPGHMPAEGSITPAQIEIISCWVDQGGLAN